jgi:hypothetical protein
MRHVIQDKVQDLRRECFVELKQGLTELIDSIIEPNEFIEKFLDLSEKTRIKLDVYSSMVHTLIRSKKIRPMVKLLLIENIFRMPRKVRFQVISSIREMEGDPECAYLKRELMFMLENRSQAADPRPSETERPRMNFLFS